MNKHRIHLFVLFSIIAYCNNVNAHIIDTLSYSVNELKIKANGNYTVFSMPFFQTTQEIGNPELPSATLYYIIPCDKRVVSITVLDSTMATIPGTYLVFPKQPETPIGNYRAYDFVNPNTSVYGSNNPYPEQPLSILDHCAIDGYQLVGISVCPLRYLPLTGKIEMITSIRFQLTFENSSETIMRPLTQPRNMFETTKNLILSQIRNKNDFNQINDGPLCITEPNSKATHGVNYWGLSLDVDPEFIIITNNNDVSGNSLFDPISGKNMTDVFQEFADWKTQKGMPTTVITVDDICSNYSGNDTQAKIHNFLTDVYHHYGMLYLILGGDVNVVPARILDTIHDGFHYSNPFLSDLYYTGVQTTWNSNRNGIYGEKRSGFHNNDQLDHTPEFYYGRVPAKNVSDAMAFVDKNMVYEISFPWRIVIM